MGQPQQDALFCTAKKGQARQQLRHKNAPILSNLEGIGKNWKELERLLTNQKAMVGQKERGDWAERVHLII